MFAVNFVLVPSNPLYLVPSFLTLWPELDNREGRGGAGLMATQNRSLLSTTVLLCEDD